MKYLDVSIGVIKISETSKARKFTVKLVSDIISVPRNLGTFYHPVSSGSL